MKLTLAAILFALTSSFVFTASAADGAGANPYEVKTIMRVTKTMAYVDGGWKDNAPGIQVELRVTRELATDKPYARAYFYDRENKLVQSFQRPAEASDDHRNYSSMPTVFKPHQSSKVWFPIDEKTNQINDRWTRIVIVFGDDNFASAEIFPKDELSKFDFPEKDLVLKSSPSTAGQTAPK